MSVFPESQTQALTFRLDWIAVPPMRQQAGRPGKAPGGRGPGHLPPRLPGDRAVHPLISADFLRTNSAGRAGGSWPHASRAWKGSVGSASAWRCFPWDPSILGWGEAGNLRVCLAITGKMQRVGSDVVKAGVRRRFSKPWVLGWVPSVCPVSTPPFRGSCLGVSVPFQLPKRLMALKRRSILQRASEIVAGTLLSILKQSSPPSLEGAVG